MAKKSQRKLALTIIISVFLLASIIAIGFYVNTTLTGRAIEVEQIFFSPELEFVSESFAITTEEVNEENISFFLEREPGTEDFEGFIIILEDEDGNLARIEKYNATTFGTSERFLAFIGGTEHNLNTIFKISFFTIPESEPTVSTSPPPTSPNNSSNATVGSTGSGGGGGASASTPELEVCGNLIIKGSEQCDLGSLNGQGYGCDASCQTESCRINSDAQGLADGITYLFIDNDNCNCDNSHTPTEARDPTTPWCDLFSISESGPGDKLQAGDTVLIKEGDYQHQINLSGQIVVRSSGTNSNKIRITSYPGDNVTLRGGSLNNSNLLIFTGDYITLDSLNFKGFINTPDGKLYIGLRILEFRGTGIEIKNLNVSSLQGNDDIGYGQHWPPNEPNKTGKETWGHAIHFSFVSNSLVENSDIGCSENPESIIVDTLAGDGLVIDDSLNITVRNNRFYDCGHISLAVRRSNSLLIEGNTIRNRLHSPLGLWGNDTIIRNNTIYEWNLYPSQSSYAGNGIQISFTASHNRVYNNVLYGSENYGHGITLGGNPENNDSVLNNSIVNNVIYNMGESGLYISNSGNFVGQNSIFNNTFANNIIIGINNNLSSTGAPIRATINAPLSLRFDEFELNNGFGNVFNANLFRNFDLPGEFNIFDRIIVKSSGGPIFKDYSVLEFNSFVFGLQNINSDPLFVDATNNDFTLQSGSPAIDAGILVLGVHCSTSGPHPGQDCLEWLGSAPDLGAFEFA